MKFLYNTLDEIPEALRSFYKARDSDGKYVLQCDGAVDASRLAEFRTKNTELKSTIEKIMAKVTGKDESDFRDVPVAELVTTAETTVKTIKDGGNAKTQKQIDDAVEARVTQMKTDFETEKVKLTKERDTFRASVETLSIDNDAIKHATIKGLRETAGPDLVARAKNVWKMGQDGKIKAVKPDGTDMYGKTGDPITMEEWVENQAKEAAHLFKESTGSGGPGNGGGTQTAGGNPWSKESWNVTRQMQMEGANPQEAQRLQGAAGGYKGPGM